MTKTVGIVFLVGVLVVAASVVSQLEPGKRELSVKYSLPEMNHMLKLKLERNKIDYRVGEDGTIFYKYGEKEAIDRISEKIGGRSHETEFNKDRLEEARRLLDTAGIEYEILIVDGVERLQWFSNVDSLVRKELGLVGLDELDKLKADEKHN